MAVRGIDRAALREKAEEHLRALAGDSARLCDDQWTAIEALVADRRRALVVQRTGWGKSAVYFVSTALLRAAGAGPTVIISPLLALMRNQIVAAERAGIHAATINSTNVEEWANTYARVHRGEIDVLLLSPERLNNPDFRDQVLPRLAATCGLLVVDEAHCISDWGHDFRPDFRRLRTLLAELPAPIPVLATTATANSRVADYLREQGYAVAAYSGQTEQAERVAAEDDLIHNRVKALVATSALGMGFDKPDLGFVVHLGAPPSPIAYYQQVGRAGRAVQHAEVVLLPGAEDAAIWRYFASLAFPPEEQVRAVLAALSSDRPLSTQALEPLVDLRRTRLELMLKVLDVDGAVRRTRGGWLATGQPWTYDTARLRRVAEARTAEQQTMIEYAATAACRMEFLRRCLDDPEAKPCGRCDTCAGPLFDADVSPEALAAAHAFLGRPGVEIAPKKLWPTGLEAVGVALKGRIAPAEQIRPGRAVGRLSDLGWGDRLRAV